jgi:predicted deacetylase
LIPNPAQFLVRFDDLCPTMSRERWHRYLPLLGKFGVRPILAVVPDNLDPELQQDEPDPNFWASIRAMEAAGATIALHGYRHLCRSLGKSLIPLHRHSEFAGVPMITQQKWIAEGLRILRNNGLNPRIWVAPRHGFDRQTLLALRSEGIKLISDGFARIPFVREGLTWIPQQLWQPVDKDKGLWTICIHANTSSASQVDRFHAFLRDHTDQFTHVDHVLSHLEPQTLTATERLYEMFAQSRVRASKALQRVRRNIQI